MSRAAAHVGRRPGPGRRAGAADTREDILRAARAQFGAHGYGGATIRAIAAAAGVDPALVMYFFGSKERLFEAAIELTINPAEVVPRLLAPGIEGLGKRLVRFHLSLWDSPETRDVVAGVVRSAIAHEQAADALSAFMGREVFGRLAEALDGPDRRLRLELAISHLFGMSMARYILKTEPLASVDAETLVETVGPVIQGYLT
jgi:AcrR family transcriptional regulator